ncbi:hypothetical protein PG995_006293 [Apiospora arundinis]
MDENGDTGRSSKPRSLRKTRRSACASSIITYPIRRTMAENNDRAEHQPEEERNEDFIKTTKPRSRAAGISRKPTASSSLGPDGRIADNA